MCSDLNKLNKLPPGCRVWIFLLRGTAVFFAIFAIAEIVLGALLNVYCFIPLDLLNLFGSIMLWRFSNAWRIYFVIMSSLYMMLEWFTADLIASMPEEAGILPGIIPAAMVLHAAAGTILLIYPGSRFYCEK